MPEGNVVVVGAGVVGLTTAFTLASEGFDVSVIDPFPGRGASFVAAGMIAPLTEAVHGEESLTELCAQGAALWPSFAKRLSEYSELDCGLEQTGTLVVAADNNDREFLRSRIPTPALGTLGATWATAAEVRALEPLLASSVRGGFLATSDFQVDNRRLLASLMRALSNLQVSVVQSKVLSILSDNNQVKGVVTEDGVHHASHVVLCPGYDVARIEGLPTADRPVIRPVKGQILRLFQHDPLLRLRRTVRAMIAGSSIYLVPRESGQFVIGATVEEQGTSRVPTGGAILALLRDACLTVPSVAEAELLETGTGLRPATIDNAPIIGPSLLGGLIYAVGHYRHGVLLGPITAQSIAEIVRTGEVPVSIAPFQPGRFQRNG